MDYLLDEMEPIVAMERLALAAIAPLIKQRKVGVIYGPVSNEDKPYYREALLQGPPSSFSLISVLASLKGMGFETKIIDPTLPGFSVKLQDIDFAFILIHGPFGEDGRLQGLLDYFRMPYLGSPVGPSAIAMSKSLSKLVAQSLSIPTSPSSGIVPRDTTRFEEFTSKLSIQFPAMLKPDTGGSSVGMLKCENIDDFISVFLKTDQNSRYFLEEFIEGIPVTIAMIQLGTRVYFTSALSIETASIFYDEETKLHGTGTTYRYPAIIPDDTMASLRRQCRELAYRTGLTVYARFDFIVRPNGETAFLEINSLPGLGDKSNFIECMKAIGFSYDEVIISLIRASLLNELDSLDVWR